jgi:hypothetical protein
MGSARDNCLEWGFLTLGNPPRDVPTITTRHLKRIRPLRIQCPARSQPGSPTSLPFPSDHDIVSPQRLSGWSRGTKCNGNCWIAANCIS